MSTDYARVTGQDRHSVLIDYDVFERAAMPDPKDPRRLYQPADVDLRRIHELKTGALIAASVGSVLALEGMDGPATIPYRRFAAELGVVFQIVDDILDVTGDEAEIGKPQGSDERHGKATYVSVFGLERARELARESHAKAQAALAEATGATQRLAGIADYILTRTT